MTFPIPRRQAGTTAAMLLAAACGSLLLSAQQPTVLSLPVGDGRLTIEPCGAGILRVVFARDPAFAGRQSLAAGGRRCETVRATTAVSEREATLETPALVARVDRATGTVTIRDRDGTVLLAERPGGRTLEAATVQGERTFHVRQQWEPADEALYGLGQHQLGLMNIKGYDVDLWQHNVSMAVPVLVSSRGYGILWDNPSYTRFGDLGRAAPIPADQLRDASGRPGGLTGSYFADARFERQVAARVDAVIDIEVPGGTPTPNTRIHPDLPPEGDISVRWEGAVVPAVSGDHIFQAYSNAGIKLWIDERLVMDHWKQGWLPWYDVARVRLEQGRTHRVRLEWSKDQGVETLQFGWKPPAADDATSLWSEVGDGIDYYVLHGPSLDSVIANYRRLTGEAPMMPRWAFGLWQSRERYRTAQESLDVLAEYRRRGLPIDVIVQDWQYWKDDAWGSHAFDEARFPDPESWIRAIHEQHDARLMISVWGKFYPGTAHFEALKAGGHLYEEPLRAGLKDWLGFPYTFYDAFSPGGGRLFWSQLKETLFEKGIDAWWMDATEPDLVQPMPTLDLQRRFMHPTALGSGARVLNAYPLVNSRAIYDGQRGSAPNQRVFILTRAAYAGQQRYASAMWSGDVTATWQAFRKQVPAGLGLSLSGLPYWTTDSGGFATPPRFTRTPMSPADAEEWRELNVRWFQYATFLPVMRLHGQHPFREPWHIAPDSHPAYTAMARFARLRYRLLPYVYSLAGAVTHEGGSFLRPLVMDFPGDPQAREIGDQFLFGPALLVNPVTTYEARARQVYLPGAGPWYDAWTGVAHAGARAIDAAAPYDTLPLFVRAGSILPLGPDLHYTGEKPADPITLIVYAGADGRFTLYEDDGLTYEYEQGGSSRIPLTWSEATGTLTIGRRDGSFTGMLRDRTFRAVLVSQDTARGLDRADEHATAVAYRGEAVEVKLR